jgi:mannosyltransferase
MHRLAGRRGDVAAVGAAAAVTLLLVLPSYTDRPFWFDELVSLEIAGLPAGDFVRYVAGTESNMALYHVLLKGWLGIAAGEAWVRALSIAFALGVLPFAYGLAKRLFDRRTAVLAVLLTSVNVSYVGYARDGRSYALTLLLVAASAFFLVRAVADARSRDWALWSVTAGLAVWAHLFAGPVVLVQLGWLAAERRSVQRRQALAAVAGLGAILLPLALAVVVGGQGAQLDWLGRPGLRQLPGLGEWFVESRLTLAVYAVGVVVALVTAWRERARPALLLLVPWLVVPPLLAFVLSYVGDPVYLYRYFLVCLPALVLLAAAGFARLAPVWLGLAVAALAMGLSVRTVEGCRPDCKIRHDDWEAAAASLEARERPGDAILFYPREVRTGLAHELDGRRPRLLYPERWDLIGGTTEGSDDLDSALAGLRPGQRVWLVTWWLPSEPAHEALERRATLADAREFAGNVHVELYEAR